MSIRYILLCLLLTISLASCTKQNFEPEFFAIENPEKLSDWGIIKVKSKILTIHSTSTIYTLNTPLFSDYAHKLRTVWTPDGSMGKTNNEGIIDFPVGTVISKTFYYPINNKQSVRLIEQVNSLNHSVDLNNYRLIETRLLVKRETGWIGLPYVWNTEQTEATLQRFGDTLKLNGIDHQNNLQTFNYMVPDVNQCAACHQWDMSKGLQPIGLQTRHMQQTKPLPTQTLTVHKAREYLDINCSHCHNPKGPANTSGLHLESFRKLSTEVGLCKRPIAAGKGTGGRNFDIDPGNSENSIFTYRLESTDPASMMPELGRSLAHQEGIELVENWITSLEQNCKPN